MPAFHGSVLCVCSELKISGRALTPADLNVELGRMRLPVGHGPLFSHQHLPRHSSLPDPCHLSPRQVSTAGRSDGLEGALLLNECGIPLEECERLDESLALALQHLVLPPEWSLMGRKVNENTGECFTGMFMTSFMWRSIKVTGRWRDPVVKVPIYFICSSPSL